MYRFAILLGVITCLSFIYLLYFISNQPANRTEIEIINTVYKTGYIQGQNALLKSQMYGINKDSLFVVDSITNENNYK